jgi:L-iditol 2-dehydrogenase
VKAAVIKGQRHIEIEDRPIPEIQSMQVLVKVGAVGICGSDVHGWQEEKSTARPPGLIMGHEAAGEVFETGTEVVDFKKGDRVAIDPQIFCYNCNACAHGWYTVCENKKVIGSALRGFLNGAMAEYVAVQQNQLFRIPDSLSTSEGAMVEPVSNALHVINRVKFNLGDCVTVIGAGTLGLCIMQAARLAGAGKLVAVDISEFRLSVAKKLGADVTINAEKSDPVEEIQRITGGRGSDVVAEAVGIERTYRQAIAMVRKTGSIMVFGALERVVRVDLYPILHKEITLIGCTGAGWECPPSIALMDSGRINVKPLITHELPLDQAQKAFEIVEDPSENTIKVILKIE